MSFSSDTPVGLSGSLMYAPEVNLRIPLYNYEALVRRLNEVCAGSTLAELEHALGYRRETIRRYLRGITKAHAPFLAAICEYFQVSAHWLLLGEGGRTHDEVIEEMIDAASLREIAAALAERFPQQIENEWPLRSVPLRRPVQVAVHKGSRPALPVRAEQRHRTSTESGGDTSR